MFIALAPVAKLDYASSSLLRYGASWEKLIESSLELAGIYEIFGTEITPFTKITCGLMPKFCKVAQSFMVTSDHNLDDTDRFQVYMGHFPSGGSL